MKTLRLALAAAAAFLFSAEALAAGPCTFLMSDQTAAGPGPVSVSSNPTPGEAGMERHSFQYHASAPRIAVRIERSDDGGASWKTVHLFTGSPTRTATGTDEIWPVIDGIPACGSCSFRAFKPSTTSWGAATVNHVISGAALDLTTPTP